jgi:Fe-S oxidoreductase
VGSEGTCATVLNADLRLVPDPPARVLLVLGFPDVYAAADRVPEVLESRPTGLEGMDDRLAGFLRRKGLVRERVDLLPEGAGWLLAEFGGADREEAVARAERLAERLRGGIDAPSVALYDEPEDQHRVWRVRESGLGATAFVPGQEDTWEGWEDSAVPPERLGGYLRDLRALLDRFGYGGAFYGHFGDGCVHTRTDFDLASAAGIAKYRAFVEAAADLVVRYGGSFSGEHGDGQSRSELLPRLYGPKLMEAFREFKAIWDPEGRMNPGRIVDPYPLDADLRLGADYAPEEPETHFRYPDDRGSFARATLRCVGVGECRKTEGGTMCPSYMVVKDEKHTTRGRARLLFEMLRGETVSDGWRSEPVKEALDLCLSCKACKGECPVNVDVATYKAEFLAHYYAGRLRPRYAYAFGLIHWWARLASRVPRLANLATQTPGLRRVAAAVAGAAPRRTLPRFATRTFRDWWRENRAGDAGARPGREVILWPDTFSTYFHPEAAIAAVEVLEDAGCRVTLPEAALCCGRPLYEYGMLKLAKRQLRQIVDALRPRIRAGVPVVGLEPSCVSVFRDELPNLFPHDQDARRLREQTYTLAEYLETVKYEPPRLRRKVLLHGHCHHRAVLDFSPERRLLERKGADLEVLDSGCCGMAGAFGYEKEKYDVSVAAGERVLLPAVRAAPPDAFIVADGFSCRGQVADLTDRRALHVAEVIQAGLRKGPWAPAAPSRAGGAGRMPRAARLGVGLAAGAGAAALGAALAIRLRERTLR